MKKYTHDFDLLASIETDEPDLKKIPPAVLKNAMRKRLDGLTDEEVHEAMGSVSVTTNPVQRKK